MDASPPTEAPPLAKVTLRAEPLITRDPSTGETEDRVRFCVIDTGPGIAPEDQARIFEKFTQLDSGYGRKHAGTGLGLAICKELTTVLQGELLLQSQLGRGSMFSVIIPARLDDATTAENKLELAFRGNLSKPAGPSDP
jgi:signal transduction histidine kinase